MMFSPLQVEGEPLNQPQTPIVIQMDHSRDITKVIDPYEGKTIPELIRVFSDEYNVSYEQMYETIKCETRFQNIQSQIVTNGKQEESYGLSQIHLPDHPHITKEQAMTPVFAIEFMAKEFSLGHQKKWTCWRKKFK